MREKLLNLSGVKQLNTFFMSKYFLILSLALACVITVFRLETVGLVIFSCFICAALVFCEDITATTLPFIFVSMLMIKCYGSYDTYIKFVWMAVPAVAAILFHFVVYRKPFVLGKTFWGTLAVAFAVTLGGLGAISVKEMFNLTSFYYVFGLGFGMVIAYLLMNSQFTAGKSYALDERFSFIMHLTGLFACFMVLSYYAMNIGEVLRKGEILDFQWRNNISTFLILAMPFSFYLSFKKPYRIWVGIVGYICILLAGSRGGTIFGSIEFLLCVAFVFCVDVKRRKRNILIFSCLFLLSLLFSGYLLDFFSITIHKIMSSRDDVRISLFTRAVEDFKSNPVFGKGLCYFGNDDLWHPAKFALNWYNSSPFQIIGSFGIVGVIAYAYQFYVRNKVIWKHISVFNISVFLSYLGIVMMSLVNPGEFCPVPYEILVTLLFIISEKCAADGSVKN